ncbi:hypothetical protein [Pseudobdellovibrio exovorus]|uniref:Lipoprotein n=1 Tax=Pseudobdellovibrio exovorus JSS TaxID=1184267 RepID=M4VT63_9BACT|nr:hypothetical protein [Pseudobdellovibrio exovorus]AGH96399.1 hypothetical protein A11Q_2183 [Pseudobdellovibrio exovorus JSS]
MKMMISGIIVMIFFVSCSNSSSDKFISPDGLEVAQQVGDFMASVDEFGAGTPSISSIEKSVERHFRQYSPADIEPTLIARLLLPEAWAASCSTMSFSNCGTTAANARRKNFSGCTIGSMTFGGTSTLQWASASACLLATASETITSVPSITATGRLGATLSITKTGAVGQRLTLVSAAAPKVFSLSSDGINRKFTGASAVVLMDLTSQTTSAITVTGADRPGRVLNGGELRVVNNRSSISCTYVPSAITWVADCNCPTMGTWTGSCSDGNSSSIQLTGCGTATVQFDTAQSSISFDRCGT